MTGFSLIHKKWSTEIERLRNYSAAVADAPGGARMTTPSTANEDKAAHYADVMMGAMSSQITSPMVVKSTVCSGADRRKHQNSASLGFVRGIHRWPVNSLHKWPVTRKMLPFDDVIMKHDNPSVSVCCNKTAATPKRVINAQILIFRLL